MSVIERLHAEAVIRQDERLRSIAPQCGHEHAFEVAEESMSAAFETMQQHLGRAIRLKTMSFGGQASPVFIAVINLTLQECQQRLVLIVHRLRGLVDEAERRPAQSRSGGRI